MCAIDYSLRAYNLAAYRAEIQLTILGIVGTSMRKDS